MKGIDLTPEQIKSAQHFVLARQTIPMDVAPDDSQQIRIEFGQLVRVVAWYGAMRYEAGQKGINSLKNPGETYVVESDQGQER